MSALSRLQITLFGESHGPAIGVCIEGLPAGIAVDREALSAFMDRRKTQDARLTTARVEGDEVHFLAGVKNGFTTGAPLNATIYNTTQRSADYVAFSQIPRPSHADYVAHVKYGGYADLNGGGHFSGRLTAATCVAGFLCKAYLQSAGVWVGAYLSEVGGIATGSYRQGVPTQQQIEAAHARTIGVLDEGTQDRVRDAVLQARAEGDSLGGVVECVALGVPVGLGECGWASMEGRISAALFAVPAVKGVEFGDGFQLSAMHGSVANDPFVLQNGRVGLKTNRNGGINGGITNGAPLLLRAAVKPTPSIAKQQTSVNLSTGEPCTLRVGGRHDACIVLRALPVIESAVAIALADALVEARGNAPLTGGQG